jgi:hypothetical protein
MRLNVVGLDNPQVNQAYGKLEDSIRAFHDLANFNLFANQDYTIMEKSPEWPWEQWREASGKIGQARTDLVQAYDAFLQVCHRNQLD